MHKETEGLIYAPTEKKILTGTPAHTAGNPIAVSAGATTHDVSLACSQENSTHREINGEKNTPARAPFFMWVIN